MAAITVLALGVFYLFYCKIYIKYRLFKKCIEIHEMCSSMLTVCLGIFSVYCFNVNSIVHAQHVVECVLRMCTYIKGLIFFKSVC